MAADPHMTWNWKWKMTVTGATALAGWLASEPIQPAGVSTYASRTDATALSSGATTAAQNARNAVAVTDIERQATHLAAGTARSTAEAELLPPRNLFRFQPRAAPRRVLTPTHVEPEPVAAPAPIVFPLRLTGIATDVVNGVPQRTAVVRGPSGLELAKAGEVAAPGYRVVTVGESSVEVERLSDGVRQQLLLTP